jgi:hypothetical protein
VDPAHRDGPAGEDDRDSRHAGDATAGRWDIPGAKR